MFRSMRLRPAGGFPPATVQGSATVDEPIVEAPATGGQDAVLFALYWFGLPLAAVLVAEWWDLPFLASTWIARLVG